MKIQKRTWTHEEDNALLACIALLGARKWQKMANILADNYNIIGRTGKQCRERWLNHLNPEVSHEPWSQEEEDQLLLLRKAFGHKWKKIAQNMQGRTDNEVKNHFYKRVRKNLRNYNRTHDDQITGNLETILQNSEYEYILVNPQGSPKAKPNLTISTKPVPTVDLVDELPPLYLPAFAVTSQHELEPWSPLSPSMMLDQCFTSSAILA